MEQKEDKLTANEIVVFDSSTFISEAGLTSLDASALRHYLYARGTQLAVPQVVVAECERHLSDRVAGHVKKVQSALGWLSRFCDGVSGWRPPNDTDVAKRVTAVSRGEGFGAVVLIETPSLRQRAEERCRHQEPPSHKKESLPDCKIWEHCLELLKDHDVVFVSGDGDFRGHSQSDDLHPKLRAEADTVSGGVLTFHCGMTSLLTDLSAEVSPMPDEEVFRFLYDAIAQEVSELEANSGGWRPTSTGTVDQQLFTTDRADIVEVRLNVRDSWHRADGDEPMEFDLSGSCQYHLADGTLRELSAERLGLYMTTPTGNTRAVQGSYVNVSAHLHAGAPPIKPEPAPVGVGGTEQASG